MGKKQLSINLISNIIAFGSSLLISFILTPYLINNLGKETFSFYPIANNFVNYMGIITSALNAMAARYITIEIVKNNHREVNKLYSSVFYANFFIAGILFIPMLLIVAFLEEILNVPVDITYSIKILFSFIFISMLVNIVTSVFGVAAVAKNRLDYNSYREIFQGVLRIILFISIFGIFDPKIWYVGVVAIILSITNLGIQVFLTKKLLPDIKIALKNFEFKTIKNLLISGIWNTLNSLGNLLLMGTSLVLANIFINSQASGDLAIVQTVTLFINGIITMLVAVFIPRITYFYANNNKVGMINEVIFSQKVVGIIVNVPILLFITFGKEFYNLWVPDLDSLKLQILSIITVLPLVVIANMWSIYNLNTILNKVKIPALCLIVVGILNVLITIVLLNYTSIGIFGIPIVYATLSIIYNIIFIPLYTSKKLEVSSAQFYKHIYKSLVGSMLITMIFIGLKSFITITTWLELFMYCLLFGVIGMAINIIVILNKKDVNYLKRFIKEKFFNSLKSKY